jgi:gamma-tubulin complex component 2
VKAAADPYFKILVRWIHRGSIDDPGKDFFVEDHELLDRTSLPMEYSDDYWERRYVIKSDQVRTKENGFSRLKSIVICQLLIE